MNWFKLETLKVARKATASQIRKMVIEKHSIFPEHTYVKPFLSIKHRESSHPVNVGCFN